VSLGSNICLEHLVFERLNDISWAVRTILTISNPSRLKYIEIAADLEEMHDHNLIGMNRVLSDERFDSAPGDRIHVIKHQPISLERWYMNHTLSDQILSATCALQWFDIHWSSEFVNVEYRTRPKDF
jgi:hypothetical protein